MTPTIPRGHVLAVKQKLKQSCSITAEQRRNRAKISINSENSSAASGDEKSEGASEFFQRTLAHAWGQTWRTSRRFSGD